MITFVPEKSFKQKKDNDNICIYSMVVAQLKIERIVSRTAVWILKE